MNWEEMKKLKMVKIKEKEIPKETIVFAPDKIRLWCQLPYPIRDENGIKLKKKDITHKKGCFQFNRNETCPDKCKTREDILEKYNIFILVYASFDFKRYKEIISKEKPEWSEDQVKCVLYWQKSVQKIMMEYISENYWNDVKFRYEFDELFGTGSGFKRKGKVAPSMEAVGIDVMNTLRNNSIDFELKPKDKVVLVSMLMFRKRMKKKESVNLNSFVGKG